MSGEVVVPDSAEAAVAAYGDGQGVTVIGGGTIVMQLLNYGRVPSPDTAILLTNAGLSYVTEDGDSVTIGAATPLADLTGLDAPLGACAAEVGDGEIQGQATIGGNLCAPTPPEHPSGDLQGALLALDATVRSTGAGGERSDPVADFLPMRHERLVLDITYHKPAAGAFAALDRPHTRHFTALGVSGARAADGTVRLAATGAGPTGVRLPSAEAAAADPEAAGRAALDDVELSDDTLASAWYREQTLPVLVRRVLEQIGGSQ